MSYIKHVAWNQLHRTDNPDIDHISESTNDTLSVQRQCAGASATMKPAAACDCYPRQRRFMIGWAACRLSTVALLPLQTDVALSRGQNLEDFVHELGKRCHQAEKQRQQIHRQITSFRGRRSYRPAGPIPLTCGYRTNLSTSFQTYVRFRKAA